MRCANVPGPPLPLAAAVGAVARFSPVRAARVLGPPLGLAAAVGLAGCFTVPPPNSRPLAPPTPPPNAPPPTTPQAVPDAVPRVEPKSRYGNPPFYDVFGRRYYVLASGAGYVERGVASWYGPGFHKIRTSSGEPYDMFGMTAAHRTLPLPAYVRVTNLQNGRSVVVRVNDRGPFVGNRIIDLSYTAAYRLDMLRDGTALVEVRTLDPGLPLDAAALGASATARDAAALRASATALDVAVVPMAGAPQGASAMTATSLPQGQPAASAPAMPRGKSPVSPPPIPPGTSPLIAQAIPQDESAANAPAMSQSATPPGAPAMSQSAAPPDALDFPQGASAMASPAAAQGARSIGGPQLAHGAVAAVSVPGDGGVQAGAFADPANAARLAAKLQSGGYGTIFVRDDVVAGRRMYRVRIGPVPDVPEFDRIVAALDQAGVHDARLALD